MNSQLSPSPSLTRPLTGPELAARRFAVLQEQLQRSRRNVLQLLSPQYQAEAHYPEGEVRDAESHAHYFYHTHQPDAGRGEEHGHFHTFLGQPGIPHGIHPQLFPEMALAPLAGAPARPISSSEPRFPGVFSHLIGVALDGDGVPISLFTTNRWVTGETWYAAEHVVEFLPRFTFDASREVPAQHQFVSEWLANVVAILRPIARELLLERDHRIADWRRRRTRHIHVLDDRRLEVVSERRIDFADALDQAIRG